MKNLFLFLCFFSFTFCFGQKSSTKLSKSIIPEINTTYIDSFENILRNDIQNKIISGGAYVLYQKGKIVATNVIGESDNQTHEPLKRNSIFLYEKQFDPAGCLSKVRLVPNLLWNPIPHQVDGRRSHLAKMAF